MARQAQSQRVGRHPRDRPAPEALAVAQVFRRPAVLLPARSRRDSHLADGSRAPHGRREADPRLSRPRQRRRQPRPSPPRPQARHRGRENNRDGDAHRLADGELRPPPRQQALHPRLSHRRAWPDDQGPAPRPPPQRSRQLLRHPRACSRRHARRHAAGQDRDHQLPRLHAPGADGGVGGDARPAQRPQRRGSPNEGDRGADAPAGRARPHGDEERLGHQRRSPPLLPLEAA